MRDLAWRMGVLVSEHAGLSTLGSEAVAAAEASGFGACRADEHVADLVAGVDAAVGLDDPV